MKLTRSEIEKRIRPVLSKYGAISVSLVGSTARDEHSNISDIDLIVEMHQPVSLLTFSKIKRELEKTLNKKVDLIERSALKPRLREHMLKDESVLAI